MQQSRVHSLALDAQWLCSESPSRAHTVPVCARFLLLLVVRCSQLLRTCTAFVPLLQVANVVGRAESLSCIFFLLSVLSYTHSIGGLRRSPLLPVSHVRWPFTLLSVVFAACAMLSKEQGITALGVCAAFDVLVHWETVIQR